MRLSGGVIFKSIGDAVARPSRARRMRWPPHWPPSARCAPKPGARSVPLRVRMALHTGVAEERDGDYFGPPLNRVARLMAAGHGGQVLLSLATEELVRDHLPPDVDTARSGQRTA